MPFRDAPDFVQTAIFPPRAVEAVIRIGFVSDPLHLQAQLEVADAEAGTLIHLESRPSVRPVTMRTYERTVQDLALVLWTMHLDPDPF